MICLPDARLTICSLLDGFILESEIRGNATLTIEGNILIEGHLVTR
jgi:hypothetical protein